MLKELKIAFVSWKKKLYLRGKKKLPVTDYLAPKVSVKNALTPLLWLLGLVYTSFFAPAVTGQSVMLDKLPTELIYIILLTPIAAILLAYFYFMIKDPKKLQSEDFQLRDRSLALVEEKGFPVTETLLSDICNPGAKKPSHEKERV